MSKTFVTVISLASVVLIADSALAQAIQVPQPNERLTRQQFNQISRNTQRLLVTLTLDRTEYFPGEEATLKISVVNPTNETLEVFEPYVPATGRLVVQRKDPVGIYKGWSDVTIRHEYGPNYNEPTQFLAARQELRREWLVPSSGDAFVTHWLRLPEEMDNYRIVYDYSLRPSVVFSIVAPRVESFLLVPLARREEFHHVDQDGKERLPINLVVRNIAIMVLSYHGQQAVAVGRSARVNSLHPKEPKPGTPLELQAGHWFSPYFRVVETNQTIKSLTATADVTEAVTITYTDDLGQTHRLMLDPRRNVISRQ